jgi:hypothetical protein
MTFPNRRRPLLISTHPPTHMTFRTCSCVSQVAGCVLDHRVCQRINRSPPDRCGWLAGQADHPNSTLAFSWQCTPRPHARTHTLNMIPCTISHSHSHPRACTHTHTHTRAHTLTHMLTHSPIIVSVVWQVVGARVDRGPRLPPTGVWHRHSRPTHHPAHPRRRGAKSNIVITQQAGRPPPPRGR